MNQLKLLKLILICSIVLFWLAKVKASEGKIN